MKKRTLLTITAMTLLTVVVAGTAAAGSPEDMVAAYHQAIQTGDIEAAKGMLAEDLLLFEDGIAETSLKHYAKGHMKIDVAFAAQMKRKLETQASWIDGDTATVSSSYDVKTKYKGRHYHIKSAETMILKQIDGQWIIVHVHWSNHQVKE